MASPRLEVFPIFDALGNPVVGATPTFTTYKNSDGIDLPQPTIVEIGGGGYGFIPVFTPNVGIFYLIATGGEPKSYSRYMRPEDWSEDTIMQVLTGKWQVHQTGPFANKLVYYDEDGSTPLYIYDLYNVGGSPSTLNPYIRIPSPPLPPT